MEYNCGLKKNIKNFYICSDHFKKDDYITATTVHNGKRRLKKSVIPSINLSASVESKESVLKNLLERQKFTPNILHKNTFDKCTLNMASNEQVEISSNINEGFSSSKNLE
ncbi:uncharacterized protein LOC114334568 isoform X3 [Diabrotica virgifera virgifera]|uniref:Uncharacterized protein LOC114334568 isoform X3 n=1 Tax=Diabrotica virgifera virgifera TaxID=50390 RepID=A0A6P7G7F4_DIAVI|nr:uncharacterized protein LOC114334568 isoform X3 [Diabrotica virgifera virgifera]